MNRGCLRSAGTGKIEAMRDWARLAVVMAAAFASLATSMEEDYRPDAASGDGGDGDGGSGITYSAAGIPAAFDRIVVVKADSNLDICAGVRLAHPGESMSFGITAPETWAVEFAYVTEGAQECAAVQFPVDTVMATGGSGSVTWTVDAGEIYPDTIDIDATLSFTPEQAWVPESVELRASDVPVQR